MIQKEEITKRDMVNDTTNIQLIGDRVLIQLDLAEDHTITDSGIVIPLAELTETDGGRITTRTSNQTFLYKGTVVNISEYAKSKFREYGVEVNVNDRVFISKNALSPAHQFFIDRDKLVLDFTGMVCIPHTLIEAKI